MSILIFRSTPLVVIFSLLLMNIGIAQDTGIDSSSSFFSKRHISVAAVATVPVITLADSYYMWWKDDYRKFSFLNHSQLGDWLDEPGSLGIDKIGHLYTSFFFYQTNKNILLWGGHSRETSILTSASISAGLALLIEVGDGFSQYGFDYQDLVFNFAGLGFGVLQDYHSTLQKYQIKWSYIPSDALTFPPKFTEHYDGHIYWLAIDITGFAQHPTYQAITGIVQPALGFSVGGLATRRECVIGLDWKIDSFFGDENDLSGLLGKTLRMIHLPAPGVKFSTGQKPEWRILLFN